MSSNGLSKSVDDDDDDDLLFNSIIKIAVTVSANHLGHISYFLHEETPLGFQPTGVCDRAVYRNTRAVG